MFKSASFILRGKKIESRMAEVSHMKARGLIHIVFHIMKTGLTILGSCEIEA